MIQNILDSISNTLNSLPDILNSLPSIPNSLPNIPNLIQNFFNSFISILINILLQFIFFCGVFMMLSPISSKLFSKGADEMGDANFLALSNATDIPRKILKIPASVIAFILLHITGNKPRLKWDDYGLGVAYDPIEDANLFQKFGIFLHLIFHEIYGVLLIGTTLYFFLPKTFASLCEGFTNWANLLNEPINRDLLNNGWEIAFDIIKDRLIIGGFNESPVLFIVLAILSVFIYSQFYFASEDSDSLTIPAVLVVIAAYNLIYGFISFESYTTLSATINGIGMIWTLVLLMYTVCNLLFVFSNKFISLITKDKS